MDTNTPIITTTIIISSKEKPAAVPRLIIVPDVGLRKGKVMARNPQLKLIGVPVSDIGIQAFAAILTIASQRPQINIAMFAW